MQVRPSPHPMALEGDLFVGGRVHGQALGMGRRGGAGRRGILARLGRNSRYSGVFRRRDGVRIRRNTRVRYSALSALGYAASN